MGNQRNLAATLGAWSARHRKTAIIGWLVFVIAASVAGGAVGQKTLGDSDIGARGSARAEKILSQAHLKEPARESVIVHSDTLTADTPAFSAAVRGITTAVTATGRVSDVRNPYTDGLVSRDRHDVLIQFAMTGDAAKATNRVKPVQDAVARAAAAHPGVTAGEYGDASAGRWINHLLGRDFARAEWTAVPLALGILLVVFGALVAALLPVALALTAFTAAIGLLALASHALAVYSTAGSVMLLVGLAVGVDYCLFYLKREREERAAGADAQTALRIAAATSGRSVLISGVTVAVAMAGMFLSGMIQFEGFAVATILVVLIAMAGSVTVLPALLAALGERVEKGRIRRRSARGPARRDGGAVWGRLLAPVLRRPRSAAVLAAGLLLVLAAPVVGMRTELLGIDKQLPASTALIQNYHRIGAAFPGGPDPAQVVVKAPDITAPDVTHAIAAFTAAARRGGQAAGPVTVTVHPAQNIAQIDVPLPGNGTDGPSRRALSSLRSDVIPVTLGPVPGAESVVRGTLAFAVDYNGQLRSHLAWVFVFVTGLTFLLVLLAFRSVAIAATSIALNLLSVGAAFGVMVAVFQHGWGAGLVGTHAPGAIDAWIPLFVFVVLFGLSMDYHVFVVSRIREAREAGYSTADAVARGIRASAGTVTSAAVIMMAVFAVFATLSLQDFKQLGVGLAVAVFLDATIVRAVLLPSVMVLLGERNWRQPRWLARRRPAEREPMFAGRSGTGPAALVSPCSDDGVTERTEEAEQG